MAPPGRQHVERVEKVQRKVQDVAAYSFGRQDRRKLSGPKDIHQGKNPETDSRGGETPSGTFEEDMGNEFQSMLKGIEGDIKRIIHVRKMRLLKNITASTKKFNEKLGQSGKNQQKQRQKLFGKYFQKIRELFQASDIFEQKTKAEEEKLITLFNEQLKVFHRARIIQKQRLKQIKKLHEDFLKSMEGLEEDHEHYFTDKYGELRQEIAKLENKILMETHHYTLANSQTIFETRYSDDFEERT